VKADPAFLKGDLLLQAEGDKRTRRYAAKAPKRRPRPRRRQGHSGSLLQGGESRPTFSSVFVTAPVSPTSGRLRACRRTHGCFRKE
jgi:hypothetical protein